MGQYSSAKTNTTVDVTNDSATVIGNGTLWSTNVKAGDAFTVRDTSVVYDVASVVSDTELTLSTPYNGSTETKVTYTIHRDFTSPDNIPELTNGDIETGTIIKRIARVVQSLFSSYKQDSEEYSDTQLNEHETSTGDIHGVPSGEQVEWKSSAQDKADSAESSANDYSDSILDTHKSSNDHDQRYYTQSEVDALIDEAKFQPGDIILHSGLISEIREGWVLCDGNNGTPDLTDRFVVGAGGNYSVGDTGGNKDAVVVDHGHSGSTTTDGYHSHSGSTSSDGSHNHDVYAGGGNSGSTVYDAFATSLKNRARRDITMYDAGNHNHSLNINGNGNHNHSLNINNAGEDGTDKNLPPYYALAYIMKT